VVADERVDAKGKASTVRLKVPMRRRGADCLVVATTWGNAHGAKGVVIVVERGPTGSNREETAIQRRAAAFVR